MDMIRFAIILAIVVLALTLAACDLQTVETSYCVPIDSVAVTDSTVTAHRDTTCVY